MPLFIRLIFASTALLLAKDVTAKDVFCPSEDFYLKGVDDDGQNWMYRHAGYLSRVNLIVYNGQTEFVCTSEFGGVSRFINGKCTFRGEGKVEHHNVGDFKASMCTLDPRGYTTNNEQCRVVCPQG